MKTTKIILLLTFGFIISIAGYGQGRHGGGHHGYGRGHGHRGVVVVKRSVYRPNKIIVYHPGWRSNYSYNRRWIYFPKYNFYWDNWRNHYVFWNGSIWFSQPAPPPVIVNVNLQNEKHYELKEKEDDTDDVYKGNDVHKSEYKAE